MNKARSIPTSSIGSRNLLLKILKMVMMTKKKAMKKRKATKNIPEPVKKASHHRSCSVSSIIPKKLIMRPRFHFMICAFKVRKKKQNQNQRKDKKKEKKPKPILETTDSAHKRSVSLRSQVMMIFSTTSSISTVIHQREA